MTNEQLVNELMDDAERLQYDSGDDQRIYDAAQRVTQYSVELLGAAAHFRDELHREVDEDSAERMKEARMAVVEAYAASLLSVYMLGQTFRIPNEAFERMVEYQKDPEKPLVMAGL